MAEEQGASAPIKQSLSEKFEPILAPLREAYDGRIAAFPVGRYGVIVVRPANGQELRLFNRRLRQLEKIPSQDGSDEAILEHGIDFVLSVTVHPTDKAEARRIIEDYFQLIPTIQKAINRISGAGVEELGKD